MNPFRLLDIGPLRGDPTFRRFWTGTSLQALAGQLSAFAVLYQMWEMTHSSLMTGMVGLTLAVPMVAFGLWGGLLADTRDKRGLILLANVGAVFFALCLLVQALMEFNSPALLLGLAAAQAGSIAIGVPSRKAIIPDLLPREKVSAGIALSYASFQAAMLGGPALAGIVSSIWGVAGCYAAETIAFLLAFRGLAALPSKQTHGCGDDEKGRLVAGFRAIWKQPPLRGSLLTDLAAMMLAMPIALFPALNEARFGGTPETLGLFLSAMAAGGIAATLLSGTITSHPSQGALQLGAALTWGLSLAVAGLTGSGWIVLACLGLAGAADTVAVMTRGTVVQLSCKSEMRGRVLAAEQIVGAAAPQIGNFRAGLMATAIPPGVALACGGTLCVIAVAAIAFSHRGLVRFRTTEPTSVT